MKLKKLAATLLALCMMLSLLPAAAIAADGDPQPAEPQYKLSLMKSTYYNDYYEIPEDELLILPRDSENDFSLYVVKVDPDGSTTKVENGDVSLKWSSGDHVSWTMEPKADGVGFVFTAGSLQSVPAGSEDFLEISLAGESSLGKIPSLRRNVRVIDHAPSVRNVSLTAETTAVQPTPGDTIPVTFTISNSGDTILDLTGFSLKLINDTAVMEPYYFAAGTVVPAGSSVTISAEMKTLIHPAICAHMEGDTPVSPGYGSYTFGLYAPKSLDHFFKTSYLSVEFAPYVHKADMKISLTPTNKAESAVYPDLPDTLYLGEESYDINFSLTNNYECRLAIDVEISLEDIRESPVESHNMTWFSDDYYHGYMANDPFTPGMSMSYTARINTSDLKAQYAAGDKVTLYIRVAAVLDANEAVSFEDQGGYPYAWEVTLAEGKAPAPSTSFEDVKEGAWYYEPVMWAVDKGITKGMGDGTFGATAPCNRAQIVTFLWSNAGKPAPTIKDNPFTDVPENAWFHDAVLWAVEKGITGGMTKTEFGPTVTCNRAQAMTFLWKAANKPASSAELQFTDVQKGAWYEKPVQWAVEKGITKGMSDTLFGTTANCLRSQIVTFMYKAEN